MTPRIENLLDRARLTARPYPQSDIAAAEIRLAARLGVGAAVSPVPPEPQGCAERPEGDAARDLRLLCEAVAGHAGALTELEEFVTGVLPAPAGARVLGCLLHLADQEEAARFWWQFAAGADDIAAAYCLFLHHLALGEEGAAELWLAQTAHPAPGEDTVAAALRILSLLKKDTRTIPDPITAVLTYMPDALAYVDDDLDLPLPKPGFTDRIRRLQQTLHAPDTASTTQVETLPERTFPRPEPAESDHISLEVKRAEPAPGVSLPTFDLVRDFNALHSALLGTQG
ncbi:hypothetical protein [Streptomyces sp. NPDC048442]|uniref:hypothetical protein n=1 Tax=Streptomyces sp. NPDC048442 TaxID=3154823 RepID=UPI0034410AF0